MAKEIILGGVPREDLDDDGNFLPGREEYNRLYNASWGGYRGEEAVVPGEQPVEAVEPARRRRNAPAPEPEPEVVPEVVVEPEPQAEQAPEQTQE